MDLTTAKCPECGAELTIPPGKEVVVCDYCGSSVIVKDLVGSGNNIDNFLSLAGSALLGGSFKEAYDYYNKVLELDGADAFAWFGKGVCAGGMTNLNDIKFDEMMVCFDNAIQNTSPDKQDDVKKRIAAEINKAVMNVITTVKNKHDIIFKPREGGGFSVDLGIVPANVKQLADDCEKALETAHNYAPENKEISENLDALQKQIKESGSFINLRDYNFPQDTRKISTKPKNVLIRIVIMFTLLAVVLILMRNYGLKDKNLGKFIKEQTSRIIKPSYTVANVSSQKGTACISVYTQSSADTELVEINEELMEKYSDKYKFIYVNYFPDENSARKNDDLQFKHNKDWIIKNAASIKLGATMAYDVNGRSSDFFKYVDGKTEMIHYPKK